MCDLQDGVFYCRSLFHRLGSSVAFLLPRFVIVSVCPGCPGLSCDSSSGFLRCLFNGCSDAVSYQI